MFTPTHTYIGWMKSNTKKKLEFYSQLHRAIVSSIRYSTSLFSLCLHEARARKIQNVCMYIYTFHLTGTYSVVCNWCLCMRAFKIISKEKKRKKKTRTRRERKLEDAILSHRTIRFIYVCWMFCSLMWKWKRDETAHSTSTKTRRRKKRKAERKRFKISCRSCDHTLSSIIQLVVRFRSQNNTFKIETALLCCKVDERSAFCPAFSDELFSFQVWTIFFFSFDFVSVYFRQLLCVLCVRPFLFDQNFIIIVFVYVNYSTNSIARIFQSILKHLNYPLSFFFLFLFCFIRFDLKLICLRNTSSYASVIHCIDFGFGEWKRCFMNLAFLVAELRTGTYDNKQNSENSIEKFFHSFFQDRTWPFCVFVAVVIVEPKKNKYKWSLL